MFRSGLFTSTNISHQIALYSLDKNEKLFEILHILVIAMHFTEWNWICRTMHCVVLFQIKNVLIDYAGRFSQKFSFQLFFFKLTHYNPALIFYTPWKHQKIIRFVDVFKRYRKAKRDWNELEHYQMYTSDYTQLLKTDFFFFAKIQNLWKIGKLMGLVPDGKC